MAVILGRSSRSRSPRRPAADVPEELRGIKAYIPNLDRRPDRWTRIDAVLKQELPWLVYERLPASDGSKAVIPEDEVATKWNTARNAIYGDYYEWVYDAPGTEIDGSHWKWACDADKEDAIFEFKREELEDEKPADVGTVKNISTGETWRVRNVFAQRYREPGLVQKMSAGERGCAHSHRRMWALAAKRAAPTLVLEDDCSLVFERSGGMGLSSGASFTTQLCKAIKEVPDFDVLYCGWSGHRGGNFKLREDEDTGNTVRKVEYVWTTVAYLLSQVGAKKLLAAANPIDQPVDNMMAWEASQGRLNSFVVLDEGDDDELWSGGIVDQFDFFGDSDVVKSDGGHQGDDATAFSTDAGGELQ